MSSATQTSGQLGAAIRSFFLDQLDAAEDTADRPAVAPAERADLPIAARTGTTAITRMRPAPIESPPPLTLAETLGPALRALPADPPRRPAQARRTPMAMSLVPPPAPRLDEHAAAPATSHAHPSIGVIAIGDPAAAGTIAAALGSVLALGRPGRCAFVATHLRARRAPSSSAARRLAACMRDAVPAARAHGRLCTVSTADLAADDLHRAIQAAAWHAPSVFALKSADLDAFCAVRVAAPRSIVVVATQGAEPALCELAKARIERAAGAPCHLVAAGDASADAAERFAAMIPMSPTLAFRVSRGMAPPPAAVDRLVELVALCEGGDRSTR